MARPDEGHGSNDGPDPEALCYGGERVLAVESLGDGWAAVTTHRVLGYTPDAAGRRFVAVDRPNVRDVGVDAAGDRRYLGWGVRGGVYGVAAVAGGVALDAVALGSALAVDPSTRQVPVGGVLAVTDALGDAFALLTTLLLVGGGLLVCGALVALVRYSRTRRPGLVVERYGEEAIRLPASRAAGERATAALSAALASDGPADQ